MLKPKKELNLIFTLDYEIHGNGDGSPMELMVTPTYQLIKLLEKYGFKLTILADVAEILCFKKYYEVTGNDRFNFKDIVIQLQNAIRWGHDVQLHIHSSYFKAEYNGKAWEQYWPEYNMAALNFERINEMVSTSILFLEEILKPIDADYKCNAFRAANWSMMPTSNIYNALVLNGISVDTSVYKGGVILNGTVCYDYTNAYSDLYPYNASAVNINSFDENGALIEYPIYTEMRYFWSFITTTRVYRMVRSKFHRHKKNVDNISTLSLRNVNDLNIKSFWAKSPWKLDFSQASSKQLINALRRVAKRTKDTETNISVVLIGHSKTFLNYNDLSLGKFLKWAQKQERITQGVFLKKQF